MSTDSERSSKINRPPSPMDPLRDVVRKSRGFISNAGNDLKDLAGELHSKFPNTAVDIPSVTHEPAPMAIQPARNIPAGGHSKLSSEETLVYQNREIGRELWMLEKHLAQGCRIPDKEGNRIPCDCCQKGSFIAALAYEAVPIAERAGITSEIYQKIARWSEDLDAMVNVSAVESGTYDYNKLSGEASALRKQLMGSLSVGSLLSPQDRATVAVRAAKMLDEESV